MGRKPVLGLVGLCVGLALTGCKDCGCGWGRNSRKDDGTAIARTEKKAQGSGQEVSTWDNRKRTVEDRSPYSPGGEAAAVKKGPYEFPANSRQVPAPTAGDSEPAEKPTTRISVPESDPAGLKAGTPTTIEVEKQPVVDPQAGAVEVPPPPPMSTGSLPSPNKLAVPVHPEQPEIVIPQKLKADAEKMLEMPEMPAPTGKREPISVPKSPVFPESKPAPTPISAPVTKPVTEETLKPDTASEPISAPVPQPPTTEKIIELESEGTPPSAPKVESSGGDLPLPPPSPPPAPEK